MQYWEKHLPCKLSLIRREGHQTRPDSIDLIYSVDLMIKTPLCDPTADSFIVYIGIKMLTYTLSGFLHLMIILKSVIKVCKFGHLKKCVFSQTPCNLKNKLAGSRRDYSPGPISKYNYINMCEDVYKEEDGFSLI